MTRRHRGSRRAPAPKPEAHPDTGLPMYDYCAAEPGVGKPERVTILKALCGDIERSFERVEPTPARKGGLHQVDPADTLAWYRRRGRLTELQFWAGRWLAVTHERIQPAGRSALADADRVQGGAGADGRIIGALDAARAVQEALRRVAPEFTPILRAVVLDGWKMAAWERRQGWPAGAGGVVLGLALSSLANAIPGWVWDVASGKGDG